jgi:hypothetical protein
MSLDHTLRLRGTVSPISPRLFGHPSIAAVSINVQIGVTG